MPRTRLVWQLFAGFSVLLTAAIAAAFWVASVQLAGQADESLRQRLADAARSLAILEADRAGPPDAAAFENHAQTVRTATRIDCRLITSGGTAAADDTLAEAAARDGIASRSRYDGASGRRSLEVAVPIGTRRPPVAIVLATTDAAESDRDLATWQRTLLAGCLGTTACAVAAGYALARRVTRPIDELRAAAARLAGGDTTTAVPATEVAELADLATALSRLRAQLVERGLTIGRQGTQQEAVLGSMIEGVLAVDARQRLLGINRAAADLLDVDPDDSAGRLLIDVIRNPDLRRFALTAIDCRAPVEDDLVLHGPRDRTIRLRGTALRDASGEGGAVIVLNDVTEMKRLEHVRRDFVANVSHELKTPIASIKGFVETLLDGAMDDPADTSRFLGIVARQADRLAAIVDDLLALSRIEQSEGAGNLPVETVPVASILTAVTLDCGPRAADRSIRLEVDCPANLAATLNAALVEQAVINLVDNALKYSESGKTVWLSAAASEPPGPRELVLCVRDEGCGIEPIHLPRLFERFYRVDKARSRNLGGTGLGLSIVKHIVQAHTGAVSVDSEPGVGTTFTIRLPRG
ncbi:MAG: HAMP domain-containing protein [Planctomycetota bacterium]|jgi:two-component system phosphate regulon sensor histidine kinase PhoR|nr:MAG: HAMP domain-containing protein [Planctomycetota bacterium]